MRLKATSEQKKIAHKDDVDRLNVKLNNLTQENRLLREDNARLKSIINHDSSNTSLPPSTDQKGGKPANTYNGRGKTQRKGVDKKGIKELRLPRLKQKKKFALVTAVIS